VRAPVNQIAYVITFTLLRNTIATSTQVLSTRTARISSKGEFASGAPTRRAA
jgi:hypothetical protein